MAGAHGAWHNAALASPAGVLAAQGEVDVVLDLVANVQDGQHLAVANVPPPKNTLPCLTAQRALLVQAKQVQLRVRHLCMPSPGLLVPGAGDRQYNVLLYGLSTCFA